MNSPSPSSIDLSIYILVKLVQKPLTFELSCQPTNALSAAFQAKALYSFTWPLMAS